MFIKMSRDNCDSVLMDSIKEGQQLQNNEKEEVQSDALEAVLKHVGEWGTYQKWLFVAMLPFGFFFAIIYFVQMFIAATPQRHWCLVPELAHLDVELRRNLSAPGAALYGEWDRCSVYAANWSKVLQTLQPPSPDTPQIYCQHGWEFELGDIPYHTVVSERGWVCDKSGYAPLAQTIFFAGSIAGGVLFGGLADAFGRIPALIGSNLIGCVGGVATIFTTGLWDFAFCRFLVGMSYDSAFMMIYILALEYVGPQYRTWVANMSIALYFGAGCLTLPWLAVWLADWRLLLWVTSLPMLMVLAVPFCIPESARWLTSKGHINQAISVLKKFERINNTTIPQDVLDDFIVSSRQTKQKQESVLALFRRPPLLTMLILLIVMYMACALVFDGIVRLSEGLGLNFFLTFTLASATEIPSVILLAATLDKWGRRWLTCTPMVIAGTLILIAVFVDRGVPVVTLAIMSRFCINMSFNGAIQWSTELLPTGVRASGSSLVHVSGYVATMLSPFVVYSERVWQSLPLIVLGIVAIVGGSAGLLLPETCGRAMPQTMADGERLVRENSLCGKKSDIDEEKWEKPVNKKESKLIP